MYHYLCVVAISLLLITPTLSHDSDNAGLDVFDINQAYAQLMYAYSSYCPQTQLQTWTCYFCTFNASITSGFVMQQEIKGILSDTFGYVGYRGKTAEVVFRGTTNIDNWIANADFAHVSPYSNIPTAFVHQGFYEDYKSMKGAVQSALNSVIAHQNVTEVYFTGHSLGGALATLAAYDLAPSLRIPSNVYTYGSPRVGNQVFTDAWYKLFPNSIRVTNMDDPVPHLPPTALNYHHVAQEVWYNKPTTYKICDTTGEDPKCSDSTLLKKVADHVNYLNIPLHSGGC